MVKPDIQVKGEALIGEIEELISVPMPAEWMADRVVDMCTRYTTAQMLSALITQTAALKSKVRPADRMHDYRCSKCGRKGHNARSCKP